MSEPVRVGPEDAGKLEAVKQLDAESRGELSGLQPASYLERWNTIFVAVGLLWIVGVTTFLLWYSVRNLPPLPQIAGMSAAQAKDALDTHKSIYDQYRQSIADVFDLLVTRTVLPIVTLLLGYLFGKSPNRSS